MKKIILATFVLCLALSCEKKDDPFNDFQSSTLIRQIGESEEFMQIFTYNSSGEIYEYLQRYMYCKYQYNDKQQLTKVEISQTVNPLSCAIIPGASLEDGDDPRKVPPSRITQFEYNTNGNLNQKDIYFVNEGVQQRIQYFTFEYENNMIKKVNSYNNQDILTQYSTFEYDSRGNVVKEDSYYIDQDENATLNFTSIFELDNKKNPFRIFKNEGAPGRNTNPNNILKETTTYFYDGASDSYSNEYVYDYNVDGFPIKVNDVVYIYGEDQ